MVSGGCLCLQRDEYLLGNHLRSPPIIFIRVVVTLHDIRYEQTQESYKIKLTQGNVNRKSVFLSSIKAVTNLYLGTYFVASE